MNHIDPLHDAWLLIVLTGESEGEAWDKRNARRVAIEEWLWRRVFKPVLFLVSRKDNEIAHWLSLKLLPLYNIFVTLLYTRNTRRRK